MGMQIWQKADVGQKVKLVADVMEIPAGTVGVVTSVNRESQIYTVRICGVDRFLYGEELEVVESEPVESVGAGAGIGAGSAGESTESSGDGARNVSGACEKCGAILQTA